MKNLSHTLRQGLQDASETQLRQVVAMVDGLEERGAVDALLVPLRPRLGALRPPRPLRLSRLLFLPLDPIIVSPQAWTAGSCAVPRTAIMPITELARAAMGEATGPIAAMIAGHSTADADVIERASALLWPCAADILFTASRPAGWAAAGLPDTAFPAIAQMVAISLRHAARIAALTQATGETLTAALEPLLDEAQAAGPAAWRVITLLLLLLRLRDKPAVLRAMSARARQRDIAIRVASDQAMEAALDHLEQTPPGNSKTLLETAAWLDSAATLLESLIGDGVGPTRAKRLQTLRAKLDADCQRQLQTALHEHVITPLAAIASTSMDPASMMEQVDVLEQTTRSLRMLQSAGQKLGNAAPYTQLLHDAAGHVRAIALGTSLTNAASLTNTDRARLLELLIGPEMGLALLDGRAGDAAA